MENLIVIYLDNDSNGILNDVIELLKEKFNATVLIVFDENAIGKVEVYEFDEKKQISFNEENFVHELSKLNLRKPKVYQF